MILHGPILKTNNNKSSSGSQHLVMSVQRNKTHNFNCKLILINLVTIERHLYDGQVNAGRPIIII